MKAIREVELFDVELHTNFRKEGVTVTKQVGSSDPIGLLTVCDEGILIEYPSDRNCMVINLDEVIDSQATIEDIPDYLKADIVQEYLSNTVDIPPRKDISFTDDELKMLYSLFHYNIGFGVPHSDSIYRKLYDYIGLPLPDVIDLKAEVSNSGKHYLCMK